MSQTQTIGRTATKIEHHGENTYVRYHNTDVVKFDSGWVMLDTGNWFTATTKLRMNQASNQFHLGYQVYQKDYKWYVVTPKGETMEFKDRWVAFSREPKR